MHLPMLLNIQIDRFAHIKCTYEMDILKQVLIECALLMAPSTEFIIWHRLFYDGGPSTLYDTLPYFTTPKQ